MSQQSALFKVVIDETSVEIFQLYFHLGPSINSNVFMNGTSYLLLDWYFEKKLCKRNFERIYAVRYNP